MANDTNAERIAQGEKMIVVGRIYPYPKHAQKVLMIRLERWGDLISWFEKILKEYYE